MICTCSMCVALREGLAKAPRMCCGRLLKESVSYCPRCGKAHAPRASAPVRELGPVCPCGVRHPREAAAPASDPPAAPAPPGPAVCAGCGATLTSGQEFCPDCGKPTSAEAVAKLDKAIGRPKRPNFAIVKESRFRG